MIQPNMPPPPKWVPGAFKPPGLPVRRYAVPSQSVQQVGEYTTQAGTTLAGLAELFYDNPRMWTRIYNANRAGARRPDGTAGVLQNPNFVPAGVRLIIPQ